MNSSSNNDEGFQENLGYLQNNNNNNNVTQFVTPSSTDNSSNQYNSPLNENFNNVPKNSASQTLSTTSKEHFQIIEENIPSQTNQKVYDLTEEKVIDKQDGTTSVSQAVSSSSSLSSSVETPINNDIIKQSTEQQETSQITEKQQQQQQSTPPSPPPKEPYTAFPIWRKRLILWLVTAAGFLGPLSGSIYLPILPTIRDEYEISTTAANASVSAFMAVFAVAPLIWASWADFGGRKMLYMISLVIYIASCICLAALPSHAAVLFVFRVVQAFGASSVQSLGAGTVADIIEPKNRAAAISIFMLGPQLGPILGPILGGAIASDNEWRWVFGFLGKLFFFFHFYKQAKKTFH